MMSHRLIAFIVPPNDGNYVKNCRTSYDLSKPIYCNDIHKQLLQQKSLAKQRSHRFKIKYGKQIDAENKK